MCVRAHGASVAGTDGIRAAGAPRRFSPTKIVLVIVLVAVLAASSASYLLFFAGNPGPNTPPHGLSIAVSPAAGTNATSFQFTALASDDQDPFGALQVRWNWQNDGTWDTPWSTNKTASHRFPVPGAYTVRMEMQDTGGLTANATKALTVSSTNLPPRIQGVEVSPATGTNETTFNFTVLVTDDHDSASAIQVRWDWENDGTWETNWSTGKTAQHRFLVAGNYTVAIEAKDTSGALSVDSVAVRVSGASTAPLRIGAVLSLTGGLQAYGGPQLNAVMMAVDEINANGGVLGQPVQLFSMDDGTNPATAAQDALILVNADHVTAIIGATGSSACAGVLPIASSSEVVEVSPSCTSPVFSNPLYTGGWFARTAPSDALQAVVAATYAYANLSQRRAAVIGINNTYGIDVASAFAANFTRLGGVLTSPAVIVNEVSGGVTDYTPVLVAVLNANPAPQFVFLVAYPPDAVLMMQNWWAGIATYPSWANVNWSFSEALYDQLNFIDPLVRSGVDVSGFTGTAPAPYAGLMPAAWVPWAARYQILFGSQPTLFTANAYDAVYLVALAAQAAGNTSGLAIRTQLRTVADAPGTIVGPGQWPLALQELSAGRDIDYDGASGLVDVGTHGDVSGSMIVWGTNATNQLVTLAFFNESLVASLSPLGTYLSVPTSSAPIEAAAWPRWTT